MAASDKSSGFWRVTFWIMVVSTFIAVITLFSTGYFAAWFGDTTVRLQGDPRQFAPLASLDAAQRLAGPEHPLVRIDARFVRSDGLVDLEADYEPDVTYTFLGKGEVDSSKPLGAGGGVLKDRCFVVLAEAPHTGHPDPDDGADIMNLGLLRMPGDGDPSNITPAPRPTCTFARLWQQAIALGAPKNAVALISYDADGYEFSIQDTPLRIVFDAKCQVTQQTGTKQNRSLQTVEQPN